MENQWGIRVRYKSPIRYQRLSLETGAAEAFEPARRLYAAFGFTSCEPFADYVLDPYSVFMTRKI